MTVPTIGPRRAPFTNPKKTIEPQPEGECKCLGGAAVLRLVVSARNAEAAQLLAQAFLPQPLTARPCAPSGVLPCVICSRLAVALCLSTSR
jgi:hypothetical protein